MATSPIPSRSTESDIQGIGKGRNPESTPNRVRMETILTQAVTDPSGRVRQLELCFGDVTDPEGGRIDVLVISAFPNDYGALPGTVIHSLAGRGIDVGLESLRKAEDWRDTWCCWMSGPLGSRPDDGAHGPLGIDRLLCFEHGAGDPGSKVGNVFRAISEYVLARYGQPRPDPIDVVRLPLLSTGDQRADKSEMLSAVIRQSILHLRGGLPAKRIQLVIHPRMPGHLALIAEAGRICERVSHEWDRSSEAVPSEYDLFLSYRRQEEARTLILCDALRQICPDIRIFRDRDQISPGAFWKHELLTAISRSERTLCLITDTYADSGECMDEFHAALCLSLSGSHRVVPLFCLEDRSIEQLPASIRDLHGVDGRVPLRAIAEVAEAVLA
jgi:hypothetical protein